MSKECNARERRSVSLGVGMTNACNLRCPHCYSRHNASSPSFLDVERLYRLLDAYPVTSINFGTGESILHPLFEQVLCDVLDRGIRVGLTSNGLTIQRMSRELLRRLHDVDVSLDFAASAEQDAFRGVGSFDSVAKAVDILLEEQVRWSLVSVLMAANTPASITCVFELAKKHGCHFRVNLLKRVQEGVPSASYDVFWETVGRLLSRGTLVACSEPIVRAACRLPDNVGDPCGTHSLRLHPDGTLSACVYLHGVSVPKRQSSSSPRECFIDCDYWNVIPSACAGCDLVSTCKGGCPARRFYGAGLDRPDEYCFRQRGAELRFVPLIADAAELVHANYLCTMILV